MTTPEIAVPIYFVDRSGHLLAWIHYFWSAILPGHHHRSICSMYQKITFICKLCHNNKEIKTSEIKIMFK